MWSPPWRPKRLEEIERRAVERAIRNDRHVQPGNERGETESRETHKRVVAYATLPISRGRGDVGGSIKEGGKRGRSRTVCEARGRLL